MKNTSYLAVSKGVAGVGGLLTVAFAGRSLGLAMFGLLILVQSYAQAASGLTKFNTWQVVVRYGSPALRQGEDSLFKRAVGFSVGLDLSSGIVTMIGAMALLPLIAHLIELPDNLVPAAMAYCLLLPTMGAGAASGILRVYDRFDLLSWQGTIQPNLRAMLAFIGWMNGWGFTAFLAIWFVTDLIGDLVLWTMAWRELKRRGMTEGLRPTLKPTGLDKAWSFAFTVNLTQSFNVVWGPISRLVVGALLTPAAAGLYRVASSIADAAQRPTDFLNKAFYPEIMRMDPQTKHPWRLMMRTIAIAIAVGSIMTLVVVVFGEWILRTLFGAQFLPAYGVMMVLLGLPLITMVSFPLPAMLHAIGKVNVPLYANIIGAVAYLLLVAPMVHLWGLIGAGIAIVAGRLLMVAYMAIALKHERRKLLAAT